MMAFLSRLASLQLTLVLMALLAATALGTYRNPSLSVTWVALPLAALGLNLLTALLTNHRFRKQTGLLVFHIGLLAILILAGLGILCSLEAHVEITEGQEFEFSQVVIDRQGPWHRLALDQVRFQQGTIAVEFHPELRRGRIRSEVWVVGEDGSSQVQQIGDGKALKMAGYRFKPTSNKGYALLLSWLDDTGETQTGSIHLPSYPDNSWRLRNDWITPAGQALSLSLADPGQAQVNEDWTLQSEGLSDVTLELGTEHGTARLAPGDQWPLQEGTLRFEGLAIWMGYRIDYNPVLSWLLLAALLAIAGLAAHFQTRFFGGGAVTKGSLVHSDHGFSPSA